MRSFGHGHLVIFDLRTRNNINEHEEDYNEHEEDFNEHELHELHE